MNQRLIAPRFGLEGRTKKTKIQQKEIFESLRKKK
jgi:hypothetical protein